MEDSLSGGKVRLEFIELSYETIRVTKRNLSNRFFIISGERDLNMKIFLMFANLVPGLIISLTVVEAAPSYSAPGTEISL